METEPCLKIVLIGDGGVGKSTMIESYLNETTEKYTSPTIGSMFFRKQLLFEGKMRNLQIWDTAGQERFRAVTPMNYKDSDGILMVCDLTDKASLFGLQDWLKSVQDHAPRDVALCIAGNKCDLDEQLEIKEEELKEFAEFCKCPYQVTSAYLNKGIEVIKAHSELYG